MPSTAAPVLSSRVLSGLTYVATYCSSVRRYERTVHATLAFPAAPTAANGQAYEVWDPLFESGQVVTALHTLKRWSAVAEPVLIDEGRWAVIFKASEGHMYMTLVPKVDPSQDVGTTEDERSCRITLTVKACTTGRIVKEYNKVLSNIRIDDSQTWHKKKLFPVAELRRDQEFINDRQYSVELKLVEGFTSRQYRQLPGLLLSAQDIVRTMADVAFVMPDVQFIFPTGDRLFAHKRVLQSTCAYFKDLFSGGFAESVPYNEDTGHVATSGVNSGSNDDDLSLLTADNSSLAGCQGNGHVIQREAVGSNEPGMDIVQVQIEDFSCGTFRAFLLYLHTGAIAFRPYGDSPTGKPKTGPKSWLREKSILAIPTADAKEIFAIADKYGSDSLKKLAESFILDEVDGNNILREMQSSFVKTFPQFYEIYKDRAPKIWDAVKASPTFSEDTRALVADPDVCGDYIQILQKLSSLSEPAEEPSAKKQRVA